MLITLGNTEQINLYLTLWLSHTLRWSIMNCTNPWSNAPHGRAALVAEPPCSGEGEVGAEGQSRFGHTNPRKQPLIRLRAPGTL